MANNDEITLQPKDGKKHMFFISAISTGVFNNVDEEGSKKLERIASIMQDKGYEIVDVKFASSCTNVVKILIIYQ